MDQPNVRLGWTPLAMRQFLELPAEPRDRVDRCVELIISFPRIGNRVRLSQEHRRRFLCGDHWIAYKLEEMNAGVIGKPIAKPLGEKGTGPEENIVTIKYVRRNKGEAP